ncbi:MAG: homocysteine S-methyltransferase family protein [Lachnospiraceae bacterium]|nr:homocysteine S-methyltransferase family protein [Lachnospiraceae bacterium]
MKPIREKLGKERLYCDGGTGSVLQSMGLKGGELPERWNIDHPDRIADLHRQYYAAGSDIVCTNTFGANRLHYTDPAELRAIIENGVLLVREGMRLAGRDDGYVALDIGPSGRLLAPMGDLGFEEAVELFGEVVRYGAAAGADLVIIETMSDTLEAKAAVLAAKENSSLPVFVTVVFDGSARMLTGGTVGSVVAMLEGLRVDALGLNCSLGPKQLLPIAKEVIARSSLPVIVNPNAGLPRQEGGKTVYDLDADGFADAMEEIAASGAHVLGGCCGTTPAFIKALIARTRSMPFKEPEPKHVTCVSSASRTVEIGARPVIIGERINPTGKKRFREALKKGDMDYILSQGIAQEDAGADILDVNVGLPEIDEPSVMENVVTQLQSICPLPLQIDTSSPDALERGLRVYNGKPMINSVNGKRESLDAVLPLAAKYGGVLVVLPLDEGGIPDTAEGRLRIAARIAAEAAGYGIPLRDLIIDGLAMTVSADQSSAVTTLATIRGIRDELHAHSILGVSNISFGLPQREIINSMFFAMAMREGLSCAIINPNSSAMMAAYRSYCALGGLDPACSGYISAYADKKDFTFGLAAPGADPVDAGRTVGDAAGPASASDNAGAISSALGEAILKGLTERASALARKALEDGADPLQLVSGDLVPALDTVGRKYENGSLFLPQLLMSAEAAKAAFEEIRTAMQDLPQKTKGRLILATVKGDIHDIGKNIVRVLLENYGYDVIDLGKDVPPEVIVDTAVREDISLIGLSALMTTTVVSMEETIKLLRMRKPDTKVVVGGAVMNREYADAIGADCYAKEAMDTVRYADSLFDVTTGTVPV